MRVPRGSRIRLAVILTVPLPAFGSGCDHARITAFAGSPSRSNMDGPARTALTTSVLGTVRVFIILVAGFTASKFPRQEREWDVSTLKASHGSSDSNIREQRVKRPPLLWQVPGIEPQETRINALVRLVLTVLGVRKTESKAHEPRPRFPLGALT